MGEKGRSRGVPNKRYHVSLTTEQRKMLGELTSAGKESARTLSHARILLKADKGSDGPKWIDEQIAQALEVSTATVGKVRQRFSQAGGGQEGLEAALHRRKPNRTYSHKLDGVQEAHLVALTCSSPPEGHKRWTLRLLAEKMVELEYADADEGVSYELVRRTLKKTGSSLG
jgi:Homeodomain-like domain